MVSDKIVILWSLLTKKKRFQAFSDQLVYSAFHQFYLLNMSHLLQIQ